VGKRRLEFVKRLLGLDGPREALVLLQESVEGQALFVEPRDEAAQGGKAPKHLLDPLEVSNRAHLVEGRDLLGVGLDPSLGNDIPQQHAMRHPEDTLLGGSILPRWPVSNRT
jgi:hypothetical protein